MRIEKFWIVCIPNDVSELIDIVFETDTERLANQFKGGLTAQEIAAVYAGPGAGDQAERHGMELLKRRADLRLPVECAEPIGSTGRACNRPLGHEGIHYHDLCLKNGRYVDEPAAPAADYFSTTERPTCSNTLGDPAAEGEAAAKAEGVEFVTAKNECPGCSGLGVPLPAEDLAHEGDEVFTCSNCGGIFGDCGDPACYVLSWPKLSTEDGKAVRYFDLTYSAGSERTHGWTDAAGRIVQFG